MTTEQFVYWLQGFMEVANPKTLDESQTQVIKDHLKLLFDKQTPDRDSEKSDPIINIPPNVWPNQIEPDWWGGKNRIICGTDPYNGDIENITTTKFCSTQMDPNGLGESNYMPKKEIKKEKKIPKKIEENRNTSFRSGIKC
jgi:hypothetical protein